MIMMKKSANVAGIMRIGTVCLIFLATSCAVERGRGEARDYLTRVTAYADAMIKGGRDTYGAVHSPLFASALNRKTMRIGAFDAIAGVRINDRSLGGANPQTDVDLYAAIDRAAGRIGHTISRVMDRRQPSRFRGRLRALSVPV